MTLSYSIVLCLIVVIYPKGVVEMVLFDFFRGIGAQRNSEETQVSEHAQIRSRLLRSKVEK